MKTAFELADDADLLAVGLELALQDSNAADVRRYAAMLRQQAEQTKALKALVDNPRSSAFGKEAEKLADDWLAANGPGGWIDDLRNKCQSLEIERDALKADAERYRKLVAMADLYIGPAYSTYNDSICDGEYCNYSQDKKQLDAFLDLFDAMKGKS